MSEDETHSTRHLSGRTYVLVWLALLVLTGLSFGTSSMSIGTTADTVITLGIAFIKAFLVVLIFMHLIEARTASRLVVIVSVVFVLLLVSLTAGDVATRMTFPRAPRGRASADTAAVTPGAVTPPSEP